jgi:hypothetical protein
VEREREESTNKMTYTHMREPEGGGKGGLGPKERELKWCYCT